MLRLAVLPPGLDDLAADATADGHRMLDVQREDWASDAVRFDGPGEALFGAYAGEALVGVVGLTRDPYLKEGEAGRVRRAYVHRRSRRHGVGRALVAAAAEAGAAAGWTRLRVRAPVASFEFYEACGFLRMVGEVSATHVMPLPGTP